MQRPFSHVVQGCSSSVNINMAMTMRLIIETQLLKIFNRQPKVKLLTQVSIIGRSETPYADLGGGNCSPDTSWRQSLASVAMQDFSLLFAKPDGMDDKSAVKPGGQASRLPTGLSHARAH